MFMPHTSDELRAWLYQLDTYTNDVFGRARTLSGVMCRCVCCNQTTADRDETGLCGRCAARSRPDQSEIVLFRPMVRRPPNTNT